MTSWILALAYPKFLTLRPCANLHAREYAYRTHLICVCCIRVQPGAIRLQSVYGASQNMHWTGNVDEHILSARLRSWLEFVKIVNERITE